MTYSHDRFDAELEPLPSWEDLGADTDDLEPVADEELDPAGFLDVDDLFADLGEGSDDEQS